MTAYSCFFEDRVVWLTGASSGIGAAVARELARRGAVLALTARRQEALESLRRELAASGQQVGVYAGDVCDLVAMKSIVSQIEATLGPLDIVIANAGICKYGDPLKFDSADYLEVLETNFAGALHTIEAALPGMLGRKCGHLVGVASLAGYRGLPRAAAYGASKSALIHFLESIRFHLQRVGISVSIVNPGFVKTPMTDQNDFPMPFLISPERAAIYLCDGIARGRKEISFPPPFNWLLKLMRVLPYALYERAVYGAWRRLGYR